MRDWQPPYVKWFTGARTNMAYNCLDRHRGTHVWNQIALYWESETGETRSLSYADVWRETTKFSDALTKLGVTQGDVACIYMPKIPELVAAMLGTVRIGAAHSVVFSGFSAQALRDRIQEAGAKVVICADGYTYRGKLIDLKKIVDDAVRECATVERVIVVKRGGNPVNWVPGRDLWYHELMAIAKPGMPAAELDSETPLYYLYTSGSTGKPKGIVHTHGGYMVGHVHDHEVHLRHEARRYLLQYRRPRLGHGPQLHRLWADAQWLHAGLLRGCRGSAEPWPHLDDSWRSMARPSCTPRPRPSAP